jgi:YVTN family beta-propeller protein
MSSAVRPQAPWWCRGPGELTLFNPATNAAVRSIAVGKQPHWVAASGDGKNAYVTNEGSNDVTVVDLTSGQTKAIPVGNAPRKVVVQRAAANTASAGAKISIANFAFAPPGDYRRCRSKRHLEQRRRRAARPHVQGRRQGNRSLASRCKLQQELRQAGHV